MPRDWDRLKRSAVFVQNVCDSLQAIVDHSGEEALTPNQAALGYASLATGVVDNGGLLYFYEGSDDVDHIIAAFEHLGYPDVANAFRSSKSVFPSESVLRNGDARLRWIENHRDSLIEQFEPLDAVIIDLGLEFVYVLEDFVRAHPEEFGIEASPAA